MAPEESRAETPTPVPEEDPEDELVLRYIEYVRTLRSWVDEKWGGLGPCPRCGESPETWVFMPTVDVPLRTDSPGYRPSKAVFPVVPLYCENCAHVEFIGAIPAGVVPADPSSPSQADAAS
jgi:hypothetical protein